MTEKSEADSEEREIHEDDAQKVQIEKDEKKVPFATFLESFPPSNMTAAYDLSERRYVHGVSLDNLIAVPDIDLFCENEKCNGIRVFRTPGIGQVLTNETWKYVFIEYECSNCLTSRKTYSLALKLDAENSPNGLAYKFGELPVFGPRTPSKLISLVGPDREDFLKGRRCESQGLGVGAFAYYRRIVENQKDRILDEIIRVSDKLSVPNEIIVKLKIAKNEQNFSKSVLPLKNAIPQVLLLNGRNPLTLLHSALSEGLHAQNDHECLNAAHDIRVVLAELSESLAQALKDKVELNAAISRLTQENNKD